MSVDTWNTVSEEEVGEEITPSSHTYPVAVGDSSAATFTFFKRGRMQKFHGSLPHKWRLRCPGRTDTFPATPRVPWLFKMCVHQSHCGVTGFPKEAEVTMWGGHPGHLFPLYTRDLKPDLEAGMKYRLNREETCLL
ncbi:hypothetical protein JXM67_01090 [candidate division WOR-3 bacterium]|nr:hypothetical protein [candidate division WOR-3 bacterium]